MCGGWLLCFSPALEGFEQDVRGEAECAGSFVYSKREMAKGMKVRSVRKIY